MDLFSFFSKLWSLSSVFPTRKTKYLEHEPKGEVEGQLKIIDSRTGSSYTVPIVNNAIKAFDLRRISTLGFEASPIERYTKGLRVLDPGLRNIAIGESCISYIDGILGTIQYRQYKLDYLVEHHDFEDVAFLLIWNHLPSTEEKANFQKQFAAFANPPRSVIEAIKAYPPQSPCFLMIIAGMGAWAASDSSKIPVCAGGNLYLGKPSAMNEAIIRTLAAISSVVGLVYCHMQGREFTAPDPKGSWVSNQLLMIGFPNSNSGTAVGIKLEKILNRLWIIYAEHEMANSTAAFLHVASTLSDPLSACMAAFLSASGPLHMGAIDLAYQSFRDIASKKDGVKLLIDDVKAKKCRLFGYGHRVYKTVDPRVKHIRSMMDELSENVNRNPLLSVALEIDRIASQDSYFTSRNLKANADLFGCFVFSALGFESEIISTMAGLARTAGLMAHWREAMCEKPNIFRPQQIFTGAVVE